MGMRFSNSILALLFTLFVSGVPARAQLGISGVALLANKEVSLTLTIPAGKNCRVDSSPDLVAWEPLVTLPPSTGSVNFTDSGAPFLAGRYYRAVPLESPAVAGDHLPTADGDVLIHPVEHGTLVLLWKGLTIFVDPGRNTGPFPGIPAADLILITHEHSDHFDTSTVNSILQRSTRIIAGQYVYDNNLSAAMRAQTTVLANGETSQWMGITVEAVAMYNLPPGMIYHPEARGNGYVLTIGGKRIYVSGDTEDTPEMRALPDIEVAFLAMNQPFTMTPEQAASAVREFRPAVVYPYHYSGSGLARFKQLVGSDLGIEVRIREWYP